MNAIITSLIIVYFLLNVITFTYCCAEGHKMKWLWYLLPLSFIIPLHPLIIYNIYLNEIKKKKKTIDNNLLKYYNFNK